MSVSFGVMKFVLVIVHFFWCDEVCVSHCPLLLVGKKFINSRYQSLSTSFGGEEIGES